MESYFGRYTKIGIEIRTTFIPDRDGRQVNGLTNPNGKIAVSGLYLNNYNITLNDVLLRGINNTSRRPGTDLGVAATILHEILHAYIMEWNDQNSAGLDPNSSLSMALQAYTRSNRIDELSQHQLMADFVSMLAETLYIYNNSISNNTRSIDMEYCENIIWTGLTKTDAYNQLSASRRYEISRVNTMEHLALLHCVDSDNLTVCNVLGVAVTRTAKTG